MNGMAYIGKIMEVSPIKDADRIMAVTVDCCVGGRWQGVVQKDQFQLGDECEVYLPDAIVPQEERFSFMDKSKYIVRMKRLKGVPSMVLIMPFGDCGIKWYGADITEITGTTKYEKELPYTVSGNIKGPFPSYIPKTDEPNFQKVPHLLEALNGKPYTITVKADGSSGTIFDHKGELHICSRNVELHYNESNAENALYKIAKEYDLDTKLKDTEMAIQFEVVGPRIQGNNMGLKKTTPLLFQVYDIRNSRYLNRKEESAFCCNYLGSSFGRVRLVAGGNDFDWTVDSLQGLADELLYENGHRAEGIVVRSGDGDYVGCERVSFKVISLLY